MSARGVRLGVGVAGALALGLAAGAQAQAPGPPDSLAPPLVPADSAARPRAARLDTTRFLAPAPPEPGRALGPPPFRTAALDVVPLVETAPGAFRYPLGAPAWPDGLSLDGLAPRRAALTLNGLPFDDLFTAAPRYDLVPLEALGNLRLADTRYGRPAAVAAAFRPFPAPRPTTDLRYLAGQSGIQFVAASHAQGGRAPAWLGGSGGRLHGLFHVGGQQASGAYVGGRVAGYRALGRLALDRPGFVATLWALHGSRRTGARRAVVAGAGSSSVFDPLDAGVLDPNAQRETVRTDLALTLRAWMFGAEPLTLMAFAARQHQRYTAGPTTLDAEADTLEAKGNRWGARLAQSFRAGPHRLLARLDGWRDGAPWGRSNPLERSGAEVQLHATVLDSLTLAGWDVTAEAGAHAVGGDAFPSASVRAARGGVFAAARLAGAAPGRVERDGYGALVSAGPMGSGERTLVAEAGVGAVRLGTVELNVRALLSETRRPRVLAALGDSAAFLDLSGAFRRALLSVHAGWRDDAPRGLYADGDITAHAPLNPDASGFHRREADALPRLWGRLRAGLRAAALFEGALDLDLFAEARAWTRFRSRTFHAPTALFALPDPNVTAEVPARGTLDLAAQARLQERATVFLVYENALADRLYDGALIVPGAPLEAHRLRFGVAWTLLD